MLIYKTYLLRTLKVRLCSHFSIEQDLMFSLAYDSLVTKEQENTPSNHN